MNRNTAQHRFNALHVRCRLRCLGLPRPLASWVSRLWERIVHPILYRRSA